jgi:two-component system, sensor histidine kinase PdtaS
LVKKTDIEVSSTFKRQITLSHKNDVDQLRYNLDYLIQQLYTSNVTLERKIEERTSDLKTSNNQLKVLLNERDILFKEVHHRVKNNLQLISSLLNIQSLKVEDNAIAFGAFQESKNRVSAIAMFHEKMYKSRQIEQLDICEFLIDLVKSICEGLPMEFNTKVKCNNVIVKTEAAVTVALIVNELIINSSKHGFKGNSIKPELEIDLIFNAYDAELRYTDNGNGLPSSFNPNTSDSLGMLILRSFCEKLGDGFHLQNKVSGTGILFTCKIDNAFIVK